MHQVSLLRSNPYTPAKRQRQSHCPALLVTLALIVVLGGCAILPTFQCQQEEKGAPTDSFCRGMRYYDQGLFRSAVAELRNVPPGHDRYRYAQKYLKRSEERIARVQHLLKSALTLRGRGRLTDAQGEVDQALKLYPKHRTLRRLKGQLDGEIKEVVHTEYRKGKRAMDQGHYETARTAFLTALMAKPDSDRVRTALSQTERSLARQYHREGTRLFEAGRLDDALPKLEQAHSMDPSNKTILNGLVDGYNARALQSYREEKLSLARRDLERSLEIAPGQPQIQKQLEAIERRMKQLGTIRP